MMRERERGIDARGVGGSGANPIGPDGAISRVRQRHYEIAIEKSPYWITVQKQHRPPLAIPLVQIRHRAAVDAGRFLLPREQLPEPSRFFVHRVLPQNLTYRDKGCGH